jgi:hypothetical protein
MTAPKVVKVMGIDARIIYEELKKLKVGDVISYSDISDIIGRDIQEDRGSLNTARNRLLEDESMCFGIVRGVGLKRLDDAEKVMAADGYLGKIRRASNRGLKTLASTDYSSLSKEDKLKHNITASHLGVLKQIASPKSKKKIEKKVIANASGMISAAAAIDVLK